ncbi:MAG: PAS domain-containing protein [Alphaproteobacteria bacterium]|nr:PAS domain-containing protein [Alphaproteobacteria bacterium]
MMLTLLNDARSEPAFPSVRAEDLPLALEGVGTYPILSQVLDAWRGLCGSTPPAVIGPEDFPRRTLSHLMIVDLDYATPNATVRLAGTRVCELYGGEMRGVSAYEFFGPDDGEAVVRQLLEAAERGEPALARRAYVSISGKLWCYTRLLLPFHPVNGRCERVLKVVEPMTLEQIEAQIAA